MGEWMDGSFFPPLISRQMFATPVSSRHFRINNQYGRITNTPTTPTTSAARRRFRLGLSNYTAIANSDHQD
jgi:hypothetical protein